MSDKIETQIASQFSILPTVSQRYKFIKELPKNFKLSSVINSLDSNTDKIEFLRLYYGKKKISTGILQKYKIKRNNIYKKLLLSDDNYNKAREILNPLRKNRENLLRKEILQMAGKKQSKYKNFYKNIQIAENIVDIVKANNYKKNLLINILKKNESFIKSNSILIDNLIDIFDSDGSLENLKPILMDFIESNDNDIEKTENNTIINNKITNALIAVYDSIDVMDNKKNFVNYIKKNENINISQSDINNLINKADEYRNNLLPQKWQEMKSKLKFTEKNEHYKAWIHGLKAGRYKGIVDNIKVYIVKQVLKKIIKKIFEITNDTSLNKLDDLLTNEKDSVDEIREEYKKVIEIINNINFNDNELLELFDSFMVYYFYLNFDLNNEKKIIDKVFNNLKKFDNNKEKLEYLKNEEEKENKSIKDKNFIIAIKNIFNNLINLYSILDGKKIEKLETPAIEDEGRAFLNNLNLEIENEGKISNLNERINNLSEETKIDVLTALSFDPRFDEYYPDIENALYHMDWGRVLGIIGLKVKMIDKRFGMVASEDYLDDIADRIRMRIGNNSFIFKKIAVMQNNLKKIHIEGARKLKYLNEKLLKAKSPAEKILELQRMSRDPRYTGVFGVIQNIERILVRDHFDEIYRKIKKLPIDTQYSLFKGIEKDLEDLLKYEPEIVEKVQSYINTVDYQLNYYKGNLPEINDNFTDAIQNFHESKLPLVDMAEIMDMDFPNEDKYTLDKVNEKVTEINHDVNRGNLLADDLSNIIEDIDNDISLLKLDMTNELNSIIENADTYKNDINKNIIRSNKLENLKNSNNIDTVINEILLTESESITDQIDELGNIFNGMHYDTEDKVKGFIIAAKKITDESSKTKINEIVEVLRRIKEEVEPLRSFESKIAALKKWIENDYKDKDYLVDFLKNQIKEFALNKGREGGLIKRLLDGMDNAKDKVLYLEERLTDIEYKFLIPMIKNLLNNIQGEESITQNDINIEFIEKSLEGKTDDEQLEWLKVRKHWDKYKGVEDIIANELEKKEKKISQNEFVFYWDIIDLAKAVLEIDGQGARQSFIKEQEANDKTDDIILNNQRKLLFYLMSTDSNIPRDRVKALVNRITLKDDDKHKYLQILKDSAYSGEEKLKDILGISDEDIAYYAVFLLYSDKALEIRIKYLERFKNSNEEKVENYKKAFDITDKIISDVIKDLSKVTRKNTEIGSEIINDDNVINQEIIQTENKIEINDNIEPILSVEKNEYNNDESILSDEENISENLEEMGNDDDKSKRTLQFGDLAEDSFTNKDVNEWEEIRKKNNSDIMDIIEKQNQRKEYEKRENISDEKSINDLNLMENDIITDDNINLDEINNINLNDKEKIDIKVSTGETFTEEDVKKWDDKVKIDFGKSTKEIIIEQKIKDDLRKKDKITKHLEELSKKESKEVIANIKKRAHEIHEEKNKKSEDKLSEILAYLTTCFPEIVSKIISDEILPVFREEGLHLDVHNVLQSINDSIFKNAMRGNNVDENIKFFSKNLSPDNINNINSIVNKIKELWKKELIEINNQEEKFSRTLSEISKGRGIESILVYLNNIYSENILNELGGSFIKNIKNDEVKSQASMLFNFLQNTFINGNTNELEKNNLQKSLELNEKYNEILNNILKKIIQFSLDNKNNKPDDSNVDTNKSTDLKLNTDKTTNETLAEEKNEIYVNNKPTYSVEKHKNDTHHTSKAPKVKLSDIFFGTGTSTNLNKKSENKQKKNTYIDKIKKEKTIKNKIPLVKNKSFEEIRKEQKEFVGKNQRELLNEAEKEINKRLEILIKASKDMVDMEAIHRNYFGNSELNRINLLNLCHEAKQIAAIIRDDRFLLSKVTFDRIKIQKLYNNKINKVKNSKGI